MRKQGKIKQKKESQETNDKERKEKRISSGGTQEETAIPYPPAPSWADRQGIRKQGERKEREKKHATNGREKKGK